jgi:hypothetical protein
VQEIRQVNNYMIWAILSTVLCCWPTGIFALIYATQVNTKIATGDIAGAQEDAKKAKMWCWITFAAGIAGLILIIIFWGAIVALAMAAK